MSQTVSMAPDRSGIVVDGEFIAGFPHIASMTERDQLRVALWAQKVAPHSVTPEQQKLLTERPRPDVSERIEGQRQDRILRSPLVRALWDDLDERQQALVLNPDRELGKRFPLSTGELSRLTGMTKRQVQYWSERHLLPFWLSENGHRQFEAAAAIVAFALSTSKQHDRQHYASVAEGNQPLAAMRRAVSVVGLSALMVADRFDSHELERTEQTLRLVADAVRELRGAREAGGLEAVGPLQLLT